MTNKEKQILIAECNELKTKLKLQFIRLSELTFLNESDQTEIDKLLATNLFPNLDNFFNSYITLISKY